MCLSVYSYKEITWRDQGLDGSAGATIPFLSSIDPHSPYKAWRTPKGQEGSRSSCKHQQLQPSTYSRWPFAHTDATNFPHMALVDPDSRQGYDIKHIVLKVFIPQRDSNRRPRNKHYVEDASALTTLPRHPIKDRL